MWLLLPAKALHLLHQLQLGDDQWYLLVSFFSDVP
jgi:hypothetical protein